MFLCKICNKTFGQGCLLKIHLKRHTKSDLITAFSPKEEIDLNGSNGLIQPDDIKTEPQESMEEYEKHDSVVSSTNEFYQNTSGSSYSLSNVSLNETKPIKKNLRRSTRVRHSTPKYSVMNVDWNDELPQKKRNAPKRSRIFKTENSISSFENFLTTIDQGNDRKSSDSDTCSANSSMYAIENTYYSRYANPYYDMNSTRFYNELIKIYVCHFCYLEYTSLDGLKKHMNKHLDQQIVNEILSMENDYYTDRTDINSMYNFFNAGFYYGKLYFNDPNYSINFYKTFLQHVGSYQESMFENLGYFCKYCGFTFFDLNIYKEHIPLAHFTS